jgi:hypothetical protein
VRHGADPRVALAGVLGVPAEEVRLREGTGSEALIRANTVPAPGLNIPNMAAADTKSGHGVPGSPAGDR